MVEIPLSEVIAAGGGIITTLITSSKLFFARLVKIEDRFSLAIERLSETVQELDKRLAVNSCIIDKFLQEGACQHGIRHRGNKKTD